MTCAHVAQVVGSKSVACRAVSMMARAKTIISAIRTEHAFRMNFLSYLQLPFQFEVTRLQKDLASILSEPWNQHGNRWIYRGEWSGLALRNGSGTPTDLDADAVQGSPFTNTPLYDRCPNIQEVLTCFDCPVGSVRLLKLAAGAEIDEHVDGGLCYEVGEARIHIPVRTNPEVDFRLNGRRVVMREGSCWYINANMPHSVVNRGLTDRIHLVIDFGVNDWLRAVFEANRSGAVPSI